METVLDMALSTVSSLDEAFTSTLPIATEDVGGNAEAGHENNTNTAPNMPSEVTPKPDSDLAAEAETAAKSEQLDAHDQSPAENIPTEGQEQAEATTDGSSEETKPVPVEDTKMTEPGDGQEADNDEDSSDDDTMLQVHD